MFANLLVREYFWLIVNYIMGVFVTTILKTFGNCTNWPGPILDIWLGIKNASGILIKCEYIHFNSDPDLEPSRISTIELLAVFTKKLDRTPRS